MRKSGVNEMIIRGKEWTSILTRRIAENEVYTSQKGDYILTNATYGLIPIYLGTYGINTATYVDTPSNIIKQKYNGQSVYDCAVDCANQSYGAGSKQFQFSIFEVDSAGVFTKYLWFKERESGAVAKTFYEWDILPGTMEMSPSNMPLKNRIIVEGDTIEEYTPSDKDTWTESSTYWTGGSGMTVGTATGKVGTNSIKGSMAAAETWAWMETTDSDWGSKFYRSDFLNAEPHYVTFWFKVSDKTKFDYCDLQLSYYDGSSTILVEMPLHLIDDWMSYTFNINRYCPGWEYVDAVQFEAGTSGAGEDIFVDELYFTKLVTTKYAKLPASQPYHDFYIKDFNLKSDAECQKVAEGLYEYRKNADRYGSFQLQRGINDLKSGDSVALKYAPKGIDISSIIVRRIEWSGRGGDESMTVYVGRQYSQAEILQSIQQKIDKK